MKLLGSLRPPSLVMVVALLIPAAAAAQLLSAVRGVVHDGSDHPLSGARVVLASSSSNWQKSSGSDAEGRFVFTTVPPGDYVVRVSLAGFGDAAQPISVLTNGVPSMRIGMIPATGLESVTVTARQQLPAADSATPTILVGRDDIERAPGATRSNSLAMITDFVPGSYLVHDQLHIRGGHQTTWAIDGVEIPNTNIAGNLGPQIDPKDIDHLEVQRGGYEASQGDRTYGVFNVVPRTGFERNDEAEVIATAGTFGTTNDYASVAGHDDRLAYYGSVNGNRSDLGIETPVAQILHDRASGYGGFATLILQADAQDQLRFVGSARSDEYQIPVSPGDMAADVQRETDAFGIVSWVHTLDPATVLTSSVFYHYNEAALEGDPHDFPISTSDRRASSYAGGQGTLRVLAARNELQTGVFGFGQRDGERFALLFNDGSAQAVHQSSSRAGNLLAAYVQDTFHAAGWLSLSGGLRQTHFSGEVTENATSPRLGISMRLPQLGWTLKSFFGEYYQAPPLATLEGPLLAFAQNGNLAFLPLHGERDREVQFGVTIPVRGWTLDLGHFRTQARNFFDHNAIGNSNIFLPLTIQAAVIRGWELTLQSPRLWNLIRAHAAYSNQTADGSGAVSGGLTDFSAPTGGFALDHDQRNTLNVGVDSRLPWLMFAAVDFYAGSGFANGDPPPSHLPSHTNLDLTLGKSFSDRLSTSLTILNVTNRHLLLDNSTTFGGFHFNDPREIYLEVRYRFGY